ncbi:MAG TPA: LacI family DNA-binding transcriptional regulator [Chthoniobacterales bacterium]
MPNIKDVAKVAGVSYTTVSHVLNNTRPVSDQARRSVQDAMRHLNYVPSAVARSLRRQATNTFGLLLTTTERPFFAELARGIEEVCFRHHYAVILCHSYDDTARQDTYLQTLLEKRVDGLIVAAVGDPEVVGHRLRSVPVPIVLVDRHVRDVEAVTIAVDHEVAAYLATQHLLELGHRLIGCIAGPASITVFPLRLAGYRRALAEAGITPERRWIAEVASLTMENGYTATRALLGNKELTAIFASSDILAIGALRSAAERGISVPRELSIIGFDGVEIGRYLTPALTSIAQPTRSLGELAATSLLECIRDGGYRLNRRLTLPPKLLIRESTGPAPS